jgi:hypothetical protein
VSEQKKDQVNMLSENKRNKEHEIVIEVEPISTAVGKRSMNREEKHDETPAFI